MITIERPYPDTLVIRDERVHNFIPALLGLVAKPLFRAAGKGLGWLARKAVGGVAAAGRGAVGLARGLVSRSAPESEQYAEQTGELSPQEEGALGEQEAEVYSDGGSGIAFRSPHFENLNDEAAMDVAAQIAGYLDEALANGAYADEINEEDEDHEYDFADAHPHIHNFKKLKKKLKKLKKVAGKLGKLAGKLGPLASMVPGLGMIAGPALSMAGSLASKGKGVARSLASQAGVELPQLDHIDNSVADLR